MEDAVVEAEAVMVVVSENFEVEVAVIVLGLTSNVTYRSSAFVSDKLIQRSKSDIIFQRLSCYVDSSLFPLTNCFTNTHEEDAISLSNSD